jgi:P27 family predicted phage terminase small subunit
MPNPPKPTELKLLQGKSPTNLPAIIDAGDALSRCPDWFDAEQRACWEYAITKAPLGLLKEIDLHTLTVFCVAQAQFKEATLMLGREGIMDTNARNGTKRNEWTLIQTKAAELMLRYGAEMGFSPVSRTKVSIGQGKKQNKFSGNGKRA